MTKAEMELVLRDAQIWLATVKSRMDPQTRLIRSLVAVVEELERDLSAEQEAHIMTAIHSGN